MCTTQSCMAVSDGLSPSEVVNKLSRSKTDDIAVTLIRPLQLDWLLWLRCKLLILYCYCLNNTMTTNTLTLGKKISLFSGNIPEIN